MMEEGLGKRANQTIPSEMRKFESMVLLGNFHAFVWKTILVLCYPSSPVQ